MGVMEDDCMLYRIRGCVRADDFATLIEARAQGMTLNFALHRPSAAVIASIMRAAHALSMSALIDIAKYFFCLAWPSHLAALTQTPIPRPAEALQLARLHNIQAMRKRAYYEILRTEDFTQAADEAAGMDMDSPLAQDDWQLLFHVRSKLLKEWRAVIHTAPDSSRCFSAAIDNGCALARAEPENTESWNKEVMLTGFALNGLFDPLCALVRLAAIDWRKYGFCGPCSDARKRLWMDKRRELWSALDGWLGLSQADED